MSATIQIVFSPDWEVMFDYNGMTDVPSGTSPYCPGQTRLVLRKCITRVHISKELDAELGAAADEGEEELRALVAKHFTPVGRARESWDEIEPAGYY